MWWLIQLKTPNLVDKVNNYWIIFNNRALASFSSGLSQFTLDVHLLWSHDLLFLKLLLVCLINLILEVLNWGVFLCLWRITFELARKRIRPSHLMEVTYQVRFIIDFEPIILSLILHLTIRQKLLHSHILNIYRLIQLERYRFNWVHRTLNKLREYALTSLYLWTLLSFRKV